MFPESITVYYSTDAPPYAMLFYRDIDKTLKWQHLYMTKIEDGMKYREHYKCPIKYQQVLSDREVEERKQLIKECMEKY